MKKSLVLVALMYLPFACVSLGGIHRPELYTDKGGRYKHNKAVQNSPRRHNFTKNSETLPPNTPPEITYRILSNLQTAQSAPSTPNARDENPQVTSNVELNRESSLPVAFLPKNIHLNIETRNVSFAADSDNSGGMRRTCSCPDISSVDEHSESRMRKVPPRPRSPALQNKLRSVELMIVCPNDYEFFPIYKYLTEATDHFQLYYPLEKKVKPMLLKSLNLDTVKMQDENGAPFDLAPLYFFATLDGAHIFCLVVGGERSRTIGVFLGDIKHYFKNLKQVILSGICGCFNTDVKLASVMVSYKCSTLKLLCGDLKDPSKGSCYVPFGQMRGKLENLIDASASDYYSTMAEQLEAYLCHSISTDVFINDKSVGNSLLSFYTNEYLTVSMEDHIVWETFQKINIPVLIIRTVSDHAGAVENTEDKYGNVKSEFECGKMLACNRLGTIMPMVLHLIFN